jgi:hypothetical protein
VRKDSRRPEGCKVELMVPHIEYYTPEDLVPEDLAPEEPR